MYPKVTKSLKLTYEHSVKVGEGRKWVAMDISKFGRKIDANE